MPVPKKGMAWQMQKKEETTMLSLMFAIMMIAVFGRLLGFAFRATWSVFKLIFTIVFLPGLLITLALSGLMIVAMPLLAIIGLASLIVPGRLRA